MLEEILGKELAAARYGRCLSAFGDLRAIEFCSEGLFISPLRIGSKSSADGAGQYFELLATM